MVDARLLELGAKSEFRHEWVITSKKSGDLRLTNDYSKTNVRNIVGDTYPIENMMSQVEKLAGSDVFNTFDLPSAYWQFWITKESRPVTAARTPEGIAVYKVAPMGMKISACVLGRGLDSTVMKELSEDDKKNFADTTSASVLKGGGDRVLQERHCGLQRGYRLACTP